MAYEDYENAYSSYLDMDNRTHARFLRSEDDRDDTPLYQKIGIGVLAGAALLAVGHRTGALHQLGRFLETEGKGTLQAAKEAWRERGSVLRPETYSEMGQAFLERRREITEELRARNEDFIRKREYDMVRYLRQRQELLEKQLPFHIEERIRQGQILNHLRQAGIREEAVHQVESAFHAARAGFLRHAGDEQLRLHLAQHGVSDQDVLNEVIRARAIHRDSIRNTAEGIAWIDGMRKRWREQTAHDIQTTTRDQSKSGRLIRGHKRATIQDILDLHEAGVIRIDADTLTQIHDVLKYNKKFGEAIFDENLYLVTKNGRTVLQDYKVYDQIGRRTMEWWAKMLPGGLLHLRDILNVKEAREKAAFRIFEAGTRQPVLNAHLGIAPQETLREPVVFSNGHFGRLMDANVINNDAPIEILNPNRRMYLTSSRFGTIGKITRQVSGIATDHKRRNKFTEALDLFNQMRDTEYAEWFSIGTKFFNPDWERNKVRKALTERLGYDDFFDMHRYFSRYTEGFSPRVFKNLVEYMPGHLQGFIEHEGINFNRDEDVLKLFEYLSQDKEATFSLRQFWGQYERDKYGVLGRKYPVGEANPFLGGYVKIQTGMDQIRQKVSLELIRQIEEVRPFASRTNIREIAEELQAQGKILRSDLEQISWLKNFFDLERRGREIYTDKDAALAEINDLFHGSSEDSRQFRASLESMVKKTNPIWQKYASTRAANRVGDEYIAVNQANFKSLSDVIKQLGFRTGRRNLEDFTTLSVFGSFYPVYRLQEALGTMGLGFSDASMGSPLQLWSSLILKRFLPIGLGVAYWQYLDYKADDWTGMSISGRWETYKANKALNEAAERDESGETEQRKREMMLHPGIEQFGEMPAITLPGLGRIGMGNLAQVVTGTLGLPTRPQDAMSEEELLEYYQQGTDPVRKGRWWLFGSKSAYRGDRIIQFAPNAYRRATSGWEYSDVTATGEERWSHSMIPTLENPLGILKMLFESQDERYWWELKHYYDRPYLLTGSLFNPNTMFFGDIGNATIGQLIKPVKQMHPEYWGNPILLTEQNEEIGQRPTGPIVTKVSPAGRMENVVLATPEEYGSEYHEGSSLVPQEDYDEIHEAAPRHAAGPGRYVRMDRLDDEGNPTGDYTLMDLQSGDTIFVPSRVAKEGYTPPELFDMAAAGPEPSEETKPRAMFSQEFAYHNEIRNRRLRNLQDPRSINWQAQEFAANWQETLGVYNWLVSEELFNYQPYAMKTVIDKADRATNISNQFWEANLGGLGGELSEIGRRFIRRDSGQLQHYDPVPNQMPDWLPGGDYFLNFHVGDPYALIPYGEYRLPGEAYEKLNPLHPDETGRYGAFDKFKILADVAPWSDEYKFWRDYVTHNITDEELRKQAADIKRQVAKRKQKYEFYEYRFKDKDLKLEKVHVTKLLDDYTFLTKEYPDTPIRLAGMRYQAKAPGVLASYIHPGDVVTIGVNADELHRVSDDTYGTMRAVVYIDNLKNINLDILQKGLMKENETDFSAPAVHARFTPKEIREGQRWETIAHFESPLNTKFLQVRSALEEYERDQVYGKDYATWQDFMIRDYLIPAYQSEIRKDPAEAAMRGAFMGAFIGRVFFGGGRRTIGGAIIGALVTGSGSLWREHWEHEHGETWIPKRRRIENDINEYFDLLNYIKYNALYNKAKDEAREEGYDVDAIVRYIQQKQEDTKRLRQQLQAEKKRLYLEQPKDFDEKKKAINEKLEAIDEDKDELVLPEIVVEALEYKKKRDSTLYGVDPYGDRLQVMAAFPYKDRWFFNAFVEASPKERQRILELVPDNEKRIYKAIWGMDPGEKPSLEDYFTKKYYLPGPDWAGWRPEYDLNDIKLKVIRNYDSLDLSDFNFWPEDVEAAKLAPDLNRGNQIYRSHVDTTFKGYREMSRRIQEVLEGQGLRDVRVTAAPSGSNNSRIIFTYQEDRSQEIADNLKQNIDQYV
ncbi:hypothetical protein [Alicyclobacillus shizuokensis]|uniref:hypothetical protein n=1 Tax=Alicyclobacillus shizuokensis TaxID=392014 RepID=UPI000835A722|nr:hypothetical protein [Alicyclobacillus shizuokensis]